MVARTHTEYLTGAAGRLEVLADIPAETPRGLALVAHPHPLMGGTLHNKVAQTLAKAFTDARCLAWRLNFRGVGESAGVHDAGGGETDDMCLLASEIRARHPGLPLFLAGFSFGAYVQARTAARLADVAPSVPGSAGVGVDATGNAVPGAAAAGRTGGSAGSQAARRLMLVGVAAARFDVPPVPADTLLIHGEVDDVIPLSHLLDWARPQELPVLVVPGADHFFHRRLAVIRTAVAAAARDSLR